MRLRHGSRSTSASLAAAVMLTVAATGLIETPAHADEPALSDHARQELPTQEQAKVVTLRTPVGVEGALAAAAKADVPLIEVRLSGNGVLGGLLPTVGEPATAQATRAKLTFQRRFGQTPVASALVVPGTTSPAEIDALQSAVATLPEATVSPTPAALVTNELIADRGPDTIRPFDGAIDEHFPSIWRGDTYRAIYPDTTEVRAYDNWFAYESAFDADPATFPDDWGMELGITLDNPDLPGSIVRPFCPPGFGDSDWDFWSGTYEMGGLWGTNVPAASEPYSDHNIVSDGCDENSVEVGIGSPSQLAADTLYLAFVELFPGNEGSSPMSASVSMKSNDCNNLGLPPHTDCMGLNTDRDPPAGFDGSALLVNRNRNWTVPACFIMGEGLTPVRLAPGVDGCPTVINF